MKDFPETAAPAALKAAVQRWRERGEPPQPPSSWSRPAWLRYFPQHHAFLSALPERIDRAEATRHTAHARTAEGAEQAFLVAMIWGYGPVGYGPWRSARVLTDNTRAAERLAEVACIAQDDGGAAAFRSLADKRLRYLGVAFGTKYLRFVTAAKSSEHATPILDAVVRRWLVTHARLPLNIDDWRPSTYDRYVALLTSRATELDLTADHVEELIFRSAISQAGSALWGEEWMRAPEPAPPQQAASQAHATLLELDRLFETADPQAATDARTHLDELATIIRDRWDGPATLHAGGGAVG
ncbi:8-oxoguanine DNA glycosylase OGG fold protein [Amycolatopsis sp. NPDC003865]